MTRFLLFLLLAWIHSIMTVVNGETTSLPTNNDGQHQQEHLLQGVVWDISIVNDKRVLRKGKKKGKKGKKRSSHSMKALAPSVQPYSIIDAQAVVPDPMGSNKKDENISMFKMNTSPAKSHPPANPQQQSEIGQFYQISDEEIQDYTKKHSRIPPRTVPMISPIEYIDQHDEPIHVKKAVGAALAPWFQCSDDPCVSGIDAMELANHSCDNKESDICGSGATCSRLCKTEMPPVSGRSQIPHLKNRCTTKILSSLTECVGTCLNDQDCQSQYGQDSRCVHPCSKDGVSAGCHCMIV